MIVAFDTETELIAPGRQAPPLVCVTWQAETEPGIVHADDPECLAQITRWLTRDDITLVGHNIAYDMGVIMAKWPHLVPLVFAKYEKDLVTDTMLRQQLLDIAANERFAPGKDGKWRKNTYHLDDLVYRARGERLKKDGWRLMYGFFRRTPLEGWVDRARDVQAICAAWLAGAWKDSDGKTHGPWPEQLEYKDVRAVVDDDPRGVIDYPLEDARATLDVFLWQEPHAEEFLQDQWRQARAYLAMHLSSVHGLKTTARGVEQYEQVISREWEAAKQELVGAGLVRADGTRNIKAAQDAMRAACEREGLEVPKTEKGAVSLDKDSCSFVEDPVIKTYSEFQTLGKILSNDIEALRKGVDLPIHPRYGLADTGRTTCTGFNVQAVRRKPGLRELFVPRPGRVFAQADYEGLELHTFAQCCMTLFGHSRMCEVLNAGQDVHLIMAARILDITYEEAAARYSAEKPDQEIVDTRQVSKPCNFGFIDGLGPTTLVEYARKVYGVTLTETKAKQLKAVWNDTWPEAQDYFGYVRDACIYEDRGKTIGRIEHLFVNRVKYGTFTGLCSALHQGLGADCAKNAAWLVARAMYCDRSSPLFGSRMVAFVHDEIIAEVPSGDRAHDAAKELGVLMLKGANEFLPDCPAEIEPLLMECWSKKAKPKYDARGRLVPWRLEET